MNTDNTRELAAIIRANRFHFKSEGIRKLADYFEVNVPEFDRSIFYFQIDHRSATPKTGVLCSCRKGMERDNCPSCEGTGKVIDFAKIRNCRV